MPVFYFVTVLLICEMFVLTQAQSQRTCEFVTCVLNGYVCRHVVPYGGIYSGVKCISKDDIPAGIDVQCQEKKYAQAILNEGPYERPPYTLHNCASGCPLGSVCSNPEKGVGSCCKGTYVPYVHVGKPGYCPRGAPIVCDREVCESDYDCRNEEKCCISCDRQCTKPVWQ